MNKNVNLRSTDLWEAMVEYMTNSPYYKIHYGTTANLMIHYAKKSHDKVSPASSLRMSDIKLAVMFCDMIGSDL